MPEIRPFHPSDLPALYDICVRTAAAGDDARGHYSTDDLMGDLFAAPYVHFEPALAYVLADSAPENDTRAENDARAQSDTGAGGTGSDTNDRLCSINAGSINASSVDVGDRASSSSDAGDRAVDGHAGNRVVGNDAVGGAASSETASSGTASSGTASSGAASSGYAGGRAVDGGRVVGYVVGTADTAGFVRRYRAEWIPKLAGRYPLPPEPPRTPEQDMHALHYNPERMLVPGLEGYPAHLHIDLLPPYQRQGHGRRLIERFLSTVPAPGVHVGMLTENVKARAFYDRLGFVELPVPDPGPLTYLGIKTM